MGIGVSVLIVAVGAIGVVSTVMIWRPRTRRGTVVEESDTMPARRTYYRETA